MVSGNFLIGDGLSLEGFKLYVQPLFEGRGYSIQDRLSVSVREGVSNNKKILTSVVGEGDLEKGINDCLVEAGNAVEAETKKKGFEGMSAYNHQISSFSHHEGEGENRKRVNVGRYQTVGSYQADDTASQLFPAIAQEYLLKSVEAKADEVVNQVKSLLDQKLSDLSS